MIKVLFVCHGNICRSPMAEFLLKDMVKKAGLADKFQIASAATSREEIGNPVHYGTRNKLEPLGISTKGKTAVQMTKKDYDYYDYIIIMDENNRRNALRLLGKTQASKLYSLLDFTSQPGDIADPWYTGDFDKTFDDIDRGCRGFLRYLKEEGKI